MGAGDELLQSFFPYRGAAVGDWLVDCSAALLTAALLWAVLPKRRRPLALPPALQAARATNYLDSLIWLMLTPLQPERRADSPLLLQWHAASSRTQR